MMSEKVNSMFLDVDFKIKKRNQILFAPGNTTFYP